MWSYVDQLAVSVLTDDLTLDDPHEATDATIDAFIEIRRAAGLSADPDARGGHPAAGIDGGEHVSGTAIPPFLACVSRPTDERYRIAQKCHVV